MNFSAEKNPFSKLIRRSTVAMLLGALGLGSQTSQASTADLFEKNTVKIQSTQVSTQGMSLAASGLMIQKDSHVYILTSEHAVLHDESSQGLGIRYDVRLSSGIQVPAHYLISDWGKGFALLELDTLSTELGFGLPWDELKSGVTSAARDQRVAIGGYPAASNQISIQGGIVDALPSRDPVLAEVPELVSLGNSFAEFGMSGGPAWSASGKFLGVVSHLIRRDENGRALPWSPDFPVDQLHVLLIPGQSVLNWLSSYFANPANFPTRLYQEFNLQAQSSGIQLIQSLGSSFSFYCASVGACHMDVTPSFRTTPARELIDDNAHDITRALARLALYDRRTGGPYSGRRYHPFEVTVRGFRPKSSSLPESIHGKVAPFSTPVEFFRMLLDPALEPVTTFTYNSLAALDPADILRNVHATMQTVSETCRTRINSVPRPPFRPGPPRENDFEKDARQGAEQLCAELMNFTFALDTSPETIAVLPVDFGTLVTSPELQNQWQAMNRLDPGLVNYLKNSLVNIRTYYSRWVLDRDADYLKVDASVH